MSNLLLTLFKTFIEPDVSETGLLRHTEDERDIPLGDVLLGAGMYQPKFRANRIKTVSVKQQSPFNTCCFASAVTQKEVQEGVHLSVKSLVAYAKKTKRLQGNGYSTLRDSQQCMIDFGVAEERILDDSRFEWEGYSNPDLITKAVVDNAAKHKASRYLAVKSLSELLKAIDDNLAVQTWMTWYTGYNMSGGLRAPYVLQLRKGIKVGGHAFVLIGYDLDAGLFEFQTTFGRQYGQNGCFFVRINDWLSLKSTGYVSVDLPSSAIAKAYEGKDVKSDSDPRIFRVENGMRRWYPNEKVFFSHGGRFGTDRSWVLISNSVLQSIPEGEPMGQKYV